MKIDILHIRSIKKVASQTHISEKKDKSKRITNKRITQFTHSNSQFPTNSVFRFYSLENISILVLYLRKVTTILLSLQHLLSPHFLYTVIHNTVNNPLAFKVQGIHAVNITSLSSSFNFCKRLIKSKIISKKNVYIFSFVPLFSIFVCMTGACSVHSSYNNVHIFPFSALMLDSGVCVFENRFTAPSLYNTERLVYSRTLCIHNYQYGKLLCTFYIHCVCTVQVKYINRELVVVIPR